VGGEGETELYQMKAKRLIRNRQVLLYNFIY